MLKPEYPFLSILCLSIILLSCGDLLNPPDTSLILISPNGDEQWEMGSIQEITWKASEKISGIGINYSLDNGVSWNNIIDETGMRLEVFPASPGSFLWTIPNVITNQAKVKIFDLIPGGGPGKKKDESNRCFSIIANKQFNNALKYYPLSIGNKWIYNSVWNYNDGDTSRTIYYITVIEATKDTVMPNKKKYLTLKMYTNNKLIKDPFFLSIDYQRVDTSTCKVYRFSPVFISRNYEYLIDDLFASPGTRVSSHRFSLDVDPSWFFGGTDVILEQEINLFNRLTSLKEYSEMDNWQKYQLVRDIGLFYHKYQGEFSTYIEELKGCVFNSEVFGDTTVTPQILKIDN